MDYKSKYTASEIDAKLSQVFDSTLQVKEVEVSEDTTITPDEGFLGLKEVNVKVNALSGGGGETMEYFLVEELPNELWGPISNLGSFYKIYYNSNSTWAIYPANAFSVKEIKSNSLYAIGIDFQSEYIGQEPFNGKLIDIFIKMGLKEQLDTIPRITKEEFYTLN
jgi:hypothetical protein